MEKVCPQSGAYCKFTGFGLTGPAKASDPSPPLLSPVPLEAQQRYLSYRAILAAIVSQNSFVFVFMGYRTLIARYVAKWGIAEKRGCVRLVAKGGGVSHHFGGVLTSLKKYRAIWVSQR